jgi:NAD(P)-dependent dehydrogenase (short-subunit alcohol dehydrogenase family)
MYKKLFYLEDKIALITGATSDIGKEIAFALAEFGSKLILTDIACRKDKLEEMASILNSKGPKSSIYCFDISSVKEIDAVSKKIAEKHKSVDILVNNAAVNIINFAENVTEYEWDTIIDINLKGLFFLTKAIGKLMIKNKYGKIINISSQTGLVGYPKRLVYATSKMGLIGMSKILAIEWAKYNINVNCIAPTFTNTEMARPLLESKKFLEEIKLKMPLGRINEPVDLIGAIIYLASKASDMVTGQTIIVDGGWTSL